MDVGAGSVDHAQRLAETARMAPSDSAAMAATAETVVREAMGNLAHATMAPHTAARWLRCAPARPI